MARQRSRNRPTGRRRMCPEGQGSPAQLATEQPQTRRAAGFRPSPTGRAWRILLATFIQRTLNPRL